MENYKFSGEVLITTDLLEDLSEEVINYILSLVHDLISNKTIEVDYLQAFDLKPLNESAKKILSITHIQEEPPYIKTHRVETDINITGRVFVIDDIDYVNMLWASTY